MSMYRQLRLAIIGSILLALTGSLLAAMLSARGYLEEQLSMKNVDNANILALSLSQQEPDTIVVELAVAALFDSGHYQSIEVIDPLGGILVSRAAALQTGTAPAWFMQLLPITAQPGEAVIMNGWTQFGTVVLRSNSSFAYTALWESALEMTLAAFVAGLLGIYLGNRVLKRLTTPLQTVIDQAQALSDRRFHTIAEPRVPELQQLASAMNSMVLRLKALFEEEARKLEVLRLEANSDPLTGLANRSFFLARLRSLLCGNDSSGGALFIIRIKDLLGINRLLGREGTDAMLESVAAVILHWAQDHAEGLAGRLNGADFALLLPGALQVTDSASQLLSRLQQETAPWMGEESAICIGYGVFPGGMEPAAVLAQIDTALAAAETTDGSNIHMANLSLNKTAHNAGEWLKLISAALANGRVRLVSFPVAALAGGLLHRECPLRMRLETGGEWIPAGQFLPMAERLKLTAQLDLAAVKLGLQELENNPEHVGLAINLSASSLETPDFLPQLETLLQLYIKDARRFWLDVPETGALHHFTAFKALVQVVKAAGARIGIEHFGRQFSQIGRFHQLGLDYLKVDGSFVHDIQDNSGNQSFLKGLVLIAQGIGLLVIAEGVTSGAELQTLEDLGFDGATGPAIRRSNCDGNIRAGQTNNDHGDVQGTD